MKLSEYKKQFDLQHPNVAKTTKSNMAFQMGMAVERARSIAGLTQTELALRVGMKQSSIARIESGTSAPNTATLKNIFDVLGIPVQINIANKEVVTKIGIVESSLPNKTIDLTRSILSPFGECNNGEYVRKDTMKNLSALTKYYS